MLNVSEYKIKVDLENKDEELCKYEEFIKNEIRHGYNYILLSEDKNIGITISKQSYRSNHDQRRS